MKESLRKIWNFVPLWIRRDFLRKIVALFLAMIVYFFVLQELPSTYTSFTVKDVPVSIQFTGNAGQYELTGGEIPKVELKMLASSVVRSDLPSSEIKCKPIIITEEQISNGTLDLPVSPSDFNCPAGYRISAVVPSPLKISVDRYVTREFPVTALFSGSLAKNYEATARIEDGKFRVKVTALDSLLKNRTEISTEPIHLDAGMTQSFDTYVGFSSLVSDANFQFNPTKVLVHVEIRKKIVSREFRKLDIILLTGKQDPPLKAELVRDYTADAVISGEKDAVSRLLKRQIKVFADVSMFDKPGIYNVDLSCWLTENTFSVDSIAPKSVQVKVYQ